MERIKIAGVYKITSPVGMVYIGQSRDINGRLRYFEQSISHNQKFEKSAIKYGFENHAKEIIHELPNDVSQEVLDRYEILYMDLYKMCGAELLNRKDGGRYGKMSEETKITMSNSSKIRWQKDGRKIICTRTGKIFNTLTDAANAFGMKRTTLGMQLRGVNRSSTTLKFFYGEY